MTSNNGQNCRWFATNCYMHEINIQLLWVLICFNTLGFNRVIFKLAICKTRNLPTELTYCFRSLYKQLSVCRRRHQPRATKPWTTREGVRHEGRRRGGSEPSSNMWSHGAEGYSKRAAAGVRLPWSRRRLKRQTPTTIWANANCMQIQFARN